MLSPPGISWLGLLLALPSLLCAQKSDPFRPGPRDRREVKNGEFRLWSADGRLQARGRQKRGKRDGTWLLYHRNGRVRQAHDYSAGKQGLFYRVYDQWGRHLRTHYTTGRRESFYRAPNRSGLQIEQIYENTSLVAEFKPQVPLSLEDLRLTLHKGKTVDEYLRDLLQDDSAQLRSQAARALKEVGRYAVHPLMHALRHGSTQDRTRILAALEPLAEYLSGSRHLEGYCHDILACLRQPSLAKTAARIALLISKKHLEGNPCVQALSSEQELDRHGALQTLSRLGPLAISLEDRIHNLVRDSSPLVARKASWVLLEIRGDTPASRLVYVEELQRPEADLRLEAAIMLEPVPKAALPLLKLLKLLEDPDERVRTQVLHLVPYYGSHPSGSDPALRPYIRHCDPKISAFALRSLVAAGKIDAEVEKLTRELLHRTDAAFDMGLRIVAAGMEHSRRFLPQLLGEASRQPDAHLNRLDNIICGLVEGDWSTIQTIDRLPLRKGLSSLLPQTLRKLLSGPSWTAQRLRELHLDPKHSLAIRSAALWELWAKEDNETARRQIIKKALDHPELFKEVLTLVERHYFDQGALTPNWVRAIPKAFASIPTKRDRERLYLDLRRVLPRSKEVLDALARALRGPRVVRDWRAEIMDALEKIPAQNKHRRWPYPDYGVFRRRFGKHATSILVESLRDPRHRETAIMGLAYLVRKPRVRGPIPSLPPRAGAPAPYNPATAQEVVPHILPHLEEEELCDTVLRALCLIGEGYEHAIPRLLRVLDESAATRDRDALVLGTLTRLGTRATPAIPKLEEFIRLRPKRARHAAKVLSAIGSKAAVALPLIRDHLRRGITWAPSTLVHVAGDDPQTLKDLLAASRAVEDIPFRSSVIRALEELGPRAAVAVPFLARALERDGQALKALGAVGPAASKAIPQIMKSAPHSCSVAVALIRIDPEAFLTYLESTQPHARRRLFPVIVALTKPTTMLPMVDRKLAIRALALLLELKDPTRYSRAMRLLMELDPNHPIILASFADYFDPANNELRSNWSRPARFPDWEVLVRRDGLRALPLLLQRLESPFPHTRREASMALAFLGPAATPAAGKLRQLLNEEGICEAKGALLCIERDPKALARLSRNLSSGPDRREALHILYMLRKAGVPTLIKAVHGGVPLRTRLSAIDTLGAMGPDAAAALPVLRAIPQTDPHYGSVQRAINRIDPE